MILIDQLPVEILLQIFRYLPNYGQVSLVNKLFYNVACDVNDIWVELSLNPETLVDPNHQSIMDDIQNTHRKVSKVSIYCSVHRSSGLWNLAMSDILKVLRKFSATIEYFALQNIEIEIGEFFEILSYVPNVQHLYFCDVFEAKHNRTKNQLSHKCLKLYHLKTLELISCGQVFLVAFNTLPAGVLKKFTIIYRHIDFDLLADFFAQQSTINKLTLHDNYDERYNMMLPDHIFDHLKLESFECSQNVYHNGHAHFLAKQTQLKSLKLLGYNAKATESVLNVITDQLCELETLEVGIIDALVVPFKRIAYLKKLNDLTLASCSLKVIETFSELDNSRITTLHMKDIATLTNDDDYDLVLDDIPPMPINLITAVRHSVPNLKVLRFDHFSECPTIAAIMEHFNFVDVLEIKFDMVIEVSRLYKMLNVARCYNANLTELTISKYFRCEDSLILKLIDIYPNLKQLHVNSLTSLTTSQLKLIVNGFKKIDSLKIEFELRASEIPKLNLTADCFDCIKDHENTWKSIQLFHVNEITAEDQNKLGAVFDIIRYEVAVSALYMANRKLLNSA